ncbi:hypothetical protein DLM45_07260 [Hyphomicrobium methylovorum]|uniref:DUF2478 domain-containing protein n=1 Tax=Hyphomicrobium methylovorum TaxID=84 RepID=UPI0015E68FC9|nr:DUF2478 domain-containing protein [Hyphomicrobium methylovorum]MBA2126020.1 hypothetical protein [Hyphomicrobium methylovorum]
MAGAPDRVAAVIGASSTRVQSLFLEVVDTWLAEGVRVAGLIEEPISAVEQVCSAGALRVIGTDERHSIFLDAPPAGTSCHVDASGAEAASASVLRKIAAADIVVLSKFGKLEAGGGGIRPAFETAMRLGIPILTAVSEKHLDAWRAFAPVAEDLAPNSTALFDWFAALRAHKAEAAVRRPNAQL